MLVRTVIVLIEAGAVMVVSGAPITSKLDVVVLAGMRL
jgi:hypothetical protein